MILAKLLKKSPREIALQIVESFKHELVDSLQIAGPGFVNIHLKPQAFTALLLEMMELQDQFFKPDTDTPRTHYSVEFVSANPTGPLHLGHGRGGIIGDVLGNILKFMSQTVTKEFYVNDAGSQIKKLGLSFKIRCQQLVGMDTQIPEGGYQGEYLIELAKQLIATEGKEIIAKPDDFFADYAKKHCSKELNKHLMPTVLTLTSGFQKKAYMILTVSIKP